MEYSRLPFDHNKRLYDSQKRITPLVLRDFATMREQLGEIFQRLQHSIDQCSDAADNLISNEHGDDCDVCIFLRNMHLRYRHDLTLFKAHLANARSTLEIVTRQSTINSASPEAFLGISLTARAVLDSAFRTAVLFTSGDIRTFNKQLADSLHALSKLVWSTLPQNIDHDLGDVLTEYSSLSNSKKNNSALYADPAPTFKAKVDHMRNINQDPGFAGFFDDCESFYNALSDMVHGGSATIAASNLQGPKIVMVADETRFVASAHQLIELTGILSVLTIKLLIYFHLPVLIYTLAGIEGCERVKKEFSALHSSLLKSVSGLSF